MTMMNFDNFDRAEVQLNKFVQELNECETQINKNSNFE
jgi:hypothetical protein